ncbi:Hemerythrin HHE cation binding domain-containing protein [Kytococcus aerolatus]|uniref:Hemerythrin HHE cation binding domain-containing protein n=1 Tax=Kytococcus aerolatus TaxID=592308 RepID=A0A212T2N2_9MICO|nr:hemerythrin domain-containing protein [Kytococcus aerolatus]SNC60106.1 Hemerythrin HHE cation binding domain-containing protein [Kytococcus aerolatus]
MCSYCGCESIEVIGRFMAEHDRLVDLTGPFLRAAAAGDAEALDTAAGRLEALLSPHTHAEEVGLFTELRKEDELIAAHVDSLCAEHASLDGLLAEVRAGAHARAPEFVHALREHMERENNGLFPAAAIALDGPQWDRVHENTPAAPDLP